MTPARICYRIAGSVLIVWLSACSMLPRSVSKPAPTVAQMPVQPFDDAVRTATKELIDTAHLPPAGPGEPTTHELVIDPLIDDATGFQVAATRSMQSQIVQALEANHPQFEIREFTQENIARGPLVLLGSLAGINSEGCRLAVKFLFKPGSTRFWQDPQISGPYDLWLAEIAHGVERHRSCLEIIGHTSPSGPATLNERLSYLRAEYIESELEAEVPQLGSRTIVNGVGSREAIVGTGADDATDVLDRRVEFKIIGC